MSLLRAIVSEINFWNVATMDVLLSVALFRAFVSEINIVREIKFWGVATMGVLGRVSLLRAISCLMLKSLLASVPEFRCACPDVITAPVISCSAPGSASAAEGFVSTARIKGRSCTGVVGFVTGIEIVTCSLTLARSRRNAVFLKLANPPSDGDEAGAAVDTV